jgi:cation:H+ antiporter
VTVTATEERHLHPARQRLLIVLAALATVPGIAIRITEPHLPHPLEALIFGLAIVGAAFILSWAAEAAQLDISAGLAIALLALIAVLPEYAVDFVFANKAGQAVSEFGSRCAEPGSEVASPCSLALANMTGANRLLIGVGWSMVVFIAWLRARSQRASVTEIRLERSHSVEIAYLTVACLYSLSLPLKDEVTLLDSIVLIGIFVAYSIRISRAPAEAPHLVGPAAYIGTLETPKRRAAVVALLAFSAVVILLTAEHFAEALVESGESLGISEFLLVQWLAPLASEAPELLVAGLYAWRLKSALGLSTLVSSKVNQWTLLVGSLPVVFAIASGSFSLTDGLPIDSDQRGELLLTAAQSVFAVAILAGLSLSTREAMWLFGLFWAQFILGAAVPESAHGAELTIVSVIYLTLGAGVLVRDRDRLKLLFVRGFRTPYRRLQEESARSDRVEEA